jgi:hypothetical protein
VSPSPLIAGRDPGALDSIELGILAGAVRALRTRADRQREKAAGGIAAAGDQFPGVTVRSPEAAMAANLADAFERIAAELEAKAPI